MSDANSPPPAPVPSQSGFATALIVIVGVILLLPGVCSLVFGGIVISNPPASASGWSFFLPFFIAGLLVGLAGIALIWTAIHGQRR